jgi:hypothetical protein
VVEPEGHGHGVLDAGDPVELGGSGRDGGAEIRLDGTGNAYVTGQTSSTNFPTTPGAFDRGQNGGVDAFVVKISE